MNHAYERALILHQQHRYADAERELKEALAGDPHNAHAHAMLGLCLAERKDFAGAAAESDAAVGLEPELAFAHYVRARVLSERNRSEEAGAAVAQALALDSVNPNYYALQAGIRFGQRRWADALASAEQGLALDADHSDCENLRAMALVQLGRRDEAGAAIGRTLARDPHNAVSHANLGWTLLHRGDHKKALEHFREALRLDPQLDWARAGMVEALKSRYLIYRLMLRYFLWMGRLGRSMQWGIIIGLYVAFQVVTNLAASHPALGPILWPIVIAYIAFAYLTWIASPLFNLLLRLNRFGRYALSREQRIASNWIGGAMLGALACLIAWPITKRFELAYGAAYFLLMVLPLSGMFRAPKGWPRAVMSLYTVALAVIGLIAIWALTLANRTSSASDFNNAQNLALAFLIGIFLEGWVANFLAGTRVKR